MQSFNQMQLEETIKDLKRQLEVTRTEIQTYRDQLKSAVKRHQDGEARIAALVQTLLTRSAWYLVARTRCNDLTFRLQQATKEIEILEGTNTTMQSRNATLQNKAEQLQKDNASMGKRCTTVEETAKCLEAANSSLGAQLEVAMKKTGEDADVIQQLEARVRTDDIVTEDKITALEDIRTSLTLQLEAALKKASEDAGLVQHLETQIQTKRIAAKGFQDAASSLERQLQVAQTRIRAAAVNARTQDQTVARITEENSSRAVEVDRVRKTYKSLDR